MDNFDNLQCEDVYDENYVMENDYEDDYDDDAETGYVSYDDLVDFGTLDFSDY